MMTLEQIEHDIEQVRAEIARLNGTCDCIETALAFVARNAATTAHNALETHCTNHIAHTNGVLADRLNDLTTAHVTLHDALAAHLSDDTAHVRSSLMAYIRLVDERDTALARVVSHHIRDAHHAPHENEAHP